MNPVGIEWQDFLVSIDGELARPADAVDLFAGPGGWDVAAADLGLSTIGIELDTAACATRRAAGLLTIEGDVRAYGPTGTHSGLIASPPCQTFSMAGSGSGRAELAGIVAAVGQMAAGGHPPVFDDPRTGLVLEPLRWLLEAHTTGHPYRWVALEQVPAVLPIWEAYAAILAELGHAAAVGILRAEQYGVPQTRARAVLIASLDYEVRLPTPTHSAYYPNNPARMDAEVDPWVSMAEALGWPDGAVVGFPRRADEPRGPGTITMDDGSEYRARDFRPATMPAFVLTEKARSWSRWMFAPTNVRSNTARRAANAPAPVLAFGHDTPRWVPEPANPADTDDDLTWTDRRPSTTIVGGSFAPDVVAAPGYRGPGDGPRQKARGSVRVSIQEAAVLQSFPANYPWQGTKSEQFQQIGNAIPPRLARAVLAEAAGGVDHA